MLSTELNETLTRVGPGTRMGNLLRHYWFPIARTPELDAEPVLAVTLLGENLALFRSDSGELGLVSQRCPHRGASLAYGIPEQDGLRCAYHGWKFARTGQCLEQPPEPDSSTFNERIKIPAYPVQELGGLIWAYLGPEPVPLLPRWDILVREDLNRSIGVTHLPCNWLQIMENSMDPIHFEWLHAVYGNYVNKRQGKPASMTPRRHEQIAFDVFEYGIYKRRLLEGEDPSTSEDWLTGHPVIFPYILAVGDYSRPTLQIRVPVDDTHTLHYWYRADIRGADQPPQAPSAIPIHDVPYVHRNGRLVVETINGQDMMAWVTQGPISDRTTERLGTSDKGVILFRNLLLEQIEKVERGEDPMGVVRDPARNERFIRIAREKVALKSYEVRRDLTRAADRAAIAEARAVS